MEKISRTKKVRHNNYYRTFFINYHYFDSENKTVKPNVLDLDSNQNKEQLINKLQNLIFHYNQKKKLILIQN